MRFDRQIREALLRAQYRPVCLAKFENGLKNRKRLIDYSVNTKLIERMCHVFENTCVYSQAPGMTATAVAPM